MSISSVAADGASGCFSMESVPGNEKHELVSEDVVATRVWFGAADAEAAADVMAVAFVSASLYTSRLTAVSRRVQVH
jgi:hypothetical protein